MTDVNSFAESEKYDRSNVIIKIVGIGIEKSNKRQNGSTWTGRNITIQDQTGLIKILMAWDKQSESFEVGNSYKVYDLSWKPYKDSMQPQLSTVTKIEKMEIPKQEKKEIISEKLIPEKLSSDEFFKKRQKEIEDEQKTYEQKINSLKKKYPEYVIEKKEQLDKLLILDSIINESLTTDDNILPNPQKVGLYMKILNGVDE